jgi:phenylacetate-CoA ligase
VTTLTGEPEVQVGAFDEWMGAWSSIPADPGDLIAWQLGRAWRHAEALGQGNPFYADRFRLPRQRDANAFRALPMTTKQDVIEDCAGNPPYGSRTVAVPADIRMVVHTSGTTGRGMAVYALDSADLEAIVRTEAVGFLWAGIREGTGVLLTLPIGMTAAGLWYSAALRAIGANVLSVGPYPTERKVDLLRQFEPEVVVGTPTYVQRLAVACEDAGFPPQEAPVKTLIVAGQAFTLPWARAIEARWGATLYEQYGCTERAIAWTCPGGAIKGDALGVLHFPPEAGYYEVIYPDSKEPVDHGEVGELVVTPFGADASPLLRYSTGDRVRWMAPGACPCGRPLAGIAAGEVERYDDMMKIRGVNVWPATFDQAIFAVEGVSDYRGRVWVDDDGSEGVEIRAEGVGDPNALAEGLAASVHRVTGLRVEVMIEPAGTLAREVPEGFVKIRRFQMERLR